jgi:multimeric flavodoxin WrbA/putative sterol carrier protein
MKVLALNSSPRGEGESKTGLMLNHLVAGMREAGADVDVVNLRTKTVRDCIGCFTCWTKTPGVCIHKDDMSQEIFPKWLDADLAVYATPLYNYTVNAAMKVFMERTLPALQPFFEQRDGRTAHPRRHKAPKAVVVSVAGFPEEAVFDQLSSYVHFLFKNGLVAEIYRPAAEIMVNSVFTEKRDDILDATTRAGAELVGSLKISEETMTRIKQPVTDAQTLAATGNLMWKTCIAEGVTPKEFRQRGMIPRPDSIETFMAIMKMGFNPQKAGEIKAILQFTFSGEGEGVCHFVIENGTITTTSGMAAKPDLTIEAPFSVWMDIVTRKADGQQMFMEQKYRAVGDLSLLMQMNRLFGE